MVGPRDQAVRDEIEEMRCDLTTLAEKSQLLDDGALAALRLDIRTLAEKSQLLDDGALAALRLDIRTIAEKVQLLARAACIHLPSGKGYNK